MELFILRQKVSFRWFCSECGHENDFVTLDDAVLLSGRSMREIMRRSEAGGFHFLESTSGHLFVCRTSLMEGSGGDGLNGRVLDFAGEPLCLEENFESR